MNEKEFFITLPSNNSMQYFPNNKTTCFTTQLPQNIKLTGEWEVGLAEIIYPCSIYNMNKRENQIQIILQRKEEKKNVVVEYILPVQKIPSKNYESIDGVLHEINKNKIVNEHIAFSFDQAESRVTAKIKTANVYSVELSPRLALQLGYPPFIDICKQKTSVNLPNLALGIPPQLYVYCDIIEPQVVGDVVTQLLRIVHVKTDKYVFGSNEMISYSQPHFVPVLRREFSNIEIDIRTNDGSKMPFQFGVLSVKLHFRQTK